VAARGIGVLMISSELPEVIGMSDRILVMRAGMLVSELTGDNITEAGIMAAATGTALGEPVQDNAVGAAL